MRLVFALLAISGVLLSACARPVDEKNLQLAKQEASAVLDRYYEAVGKADFAGFIQEFSKEAYFYGTDATEIWPYEEFAPAIKESFAKGVGWDFDLKDRRVQVSQNGDVAWFAELAHFKNTDYLLRPTGVMAKQNGQWKITQLVMGMPIPNLLYPPVLQGLQASDAGPKIEKAKIDTVLNHLHQYAANADGDAYFALYSDDAIFLGTDVTERWTKAAFQAYAAPIFAKGRGWVYIPRGRHITLSPMRNMAWFDEVLDSQSYGTSRGSGVLVRTREGWKISQYNLTFPIPNDLADAMTRKIMDYEKAAKVAAGTE